MIPTHYTSRSNLVFTEADIERGNVVARSFQGLSTRQRIGANDPFDGLLFTIDSWGELYAYDTSGTPAPFFSGNRVSVATGIEDARGLAFNSTLFHITDQRHADQGHGLPTAFDDSNGLKSVVVEVEPNDTFATAMDLEREFWHQGYDSNIGDEQVLVPPSNTSRKFPHVSVNGSGDGTHDYYSFQVDTPGSLIHVDIDSNIDHLLHPNGIPDMELLLLNENGGIMEGPTPIFPTCPACADEDSLLLGDLGSIAQSDPYLENPAQPVGYLINTPGRYIIQVTKAFPALATFLQPLDEGDYYTLNISVQNHRVDGPKTDGGNSFFFGTNILGQIDDASNDMPIVITSPDHGLADGDRVYIQDVEGNVEANGTWVISVNDIDTFELETSDGRLPPNQGRSSLYTGGGTWRHLRMPEDVQGELVTNPFSLKGYAAADKPVFYFNYYMELEDDPNIDVFNVILIEENGVEHTIASKNNGIVNTPPTSPVLPVWRQARIELDQFAGKENMRLRFEFDSVDSISSQAEGVFIDDLIIGFAERGEMVADARNDGTFAINTDAPTDEVLIGDYQLEIRVGTDFATSGPIIPDTQRLNSLTLHSTFDTNDRQTRQLTLEVPDGSHFTDGDIFTLGDGIDPVTFEFDTGGGVGVGNIRVPFLGTDPDFIVARSIRDAINSQSVQTVLDVTAGMSDGTIVGAAGNDNRLNLYGNAVFSGNIPVTAHYGQGDTNLLREQGQVLVHSNYITDSLDWGILSEGGKRDAEPLVPVNFLQSHNAPVRNLLSVNNLPVGGLTPGVVIENNVIAGEGLGGIHFAGEVRPIEIVPLLGLPTPGDQVCDGWTFTLETARQTVTFEWDDISGSGAPCGSRIQAGSGWQEGNVPVFYRRSGGYIGRGIGYSQLEMAYAIRDAINSSPLVANDTGEGVRATVYHSRMMGDPAAGPDFAVYVEGAISLSQNPPQNFHARRVGIGDSPQPFGRLINNTVYGNDGTESDFSGTAIDEPNDTIADAIQSRQGRAQSPQVYQDTAYLGDNLDIQGDPSLDVDFYQLQLETHERVTVDIDAAEALPASAAISYDPLLFNNVNNNMVVTANQVGEFYNNIDIIIADTGGLFAVATLDIDDRELTIEIDPLFHTGLDVIQAINFEGHVHGDARPVTGCHQRRLRIGRPARTGGHDRRRNARNRC